LGKLTVVGIGPGDYENMTVRADRALKECQVIVGYHVYVDLVRERYPDKEFLTTPMTREADRCRMALDEARSGRDVAMICSGDSGIYGMASPVLFLSPEYPKVEVEIVAGLTAANAGAAVLGAPLGHDFCVISLSDLLTPWETIEKRLRLATQGEFALCLYNPSSRKRRDYLRTACEIVLAEGRAPDTLCGWVRNIGRPGEAAKLLTLAQLREEQVDMFTTVYIGNSTTREVQGRMVTPRGYRT